MACKLQGKFDHFHFLEISKVEPNDKKAKNFGHKINEVIYRTQEQCEKRMETRQANILAGRSNGENWKKRGNTTKRKNYIAQGFTYNSFIRPSTEHEGNETISLMFRECQPAIKLVGKSAELIGAGAAR